MMFSIRDAQIVSSQRGVIFVHLVGVVEHCWWKDNPRFWCRKFLSCIFALDLWLDCIFLYRIFSRRSTSVFSICPFAWNSLPDRLHQINDTSLFKRRL